MSASNGGIKTDLAKLDAHVVQPAEYEDAPEWTDEMFDRAELRHGDRVIRPATGTLTRDYIAEAEAAPKEQVTLPLDAAALARFRADGPDWQTRINAALRKAAGV